MKFLILIICAFAAFSASSQPVVAMHIDYSLKYHSGGGIDAGYNLNRSYVGVNTAIHFTRQRDVPVYVNLQYGYTIGKLMPFASYGYYTAGGEAVHNHEGAQGFAMGGGLSYFPTPQLKISTGIIGSNVFFSLAANIIFN